VIVGSIVTSAEGVTALSMRLPRSEVREIKGGSHMLLLEHPQEVLVFVASVAALGWLGVQWTTALRPLGAWRWTMAAVVIAFAVLLIVAGGGWLYAAFKALGELGRQTPQG
jgi:hypothetical protein